jgi:hypothetical protein
MTPAAADPVNFKKLRRDNADMMSLSLVNLFFDDAPPAGFAQPARRRRRSGCRAVPMQTLLARAGTLS